MIEFEMDTMDLSEEFDLDRQDVDALLEQSVKAVTMAFARHWDNQAKNNLRSSRDVYRNAIQVDQQGRFTGIAYLNPSAWLANAIEVGHSSFDMKKGLLSSPKVTQGENGPYITVPFQFATPGSIGESGVFAGVMPKEIHQAAKKREKATPNSPGLKMQDIPAKHQIPKSNALRNKIKDIGFDQVMKNSEKNTSIYAGLQRRAKGSGYVNFRRVSLNSQADSWIHPGFDAKDLASDALQQLDIPHELDMAIDTYLNSLGYE